MAAVGNAHFISMLVPGYPSVSAIPGYSEFSAKVRDLSLREDVIIKTCYIYAYYVWNKNAENEWGGRDVYASYFPKMDQSDEELQSEIKNNIEEQMKHSEDARAKYKEWHAVLCLPTTDPKVQQSLKFCRTTWNGDHHHKTWLKHIEGIFSHFDQITTTKALKTFTMRIVYQTSNGLDSMELWESVLDN